MTHDFRKFTKKIKKATINIKDNIIKIVNIFENVINNNVIKNKKISLFLRFKLRRQNTIIEENQFSLKYNNY